MSVAEYKVGLSPHEAGSCVVEEGADEKRQLELRASYGFVRRFASLIDWSWTCVPTPRAGRRRVLTREGGGRASLKDHRGVSGTPALQVAWKYEHSSVQLTELFKGLSSRRLTHSPEFSLRLVSSAHRQVYRR